MVWRTLTPEQLVGIEGIAMDMGAPYFASVVVDGKNKVVFDKYHLAKYLSEALDQKSADPSVESNRLKGRRWLLLRTARNIEPRPEARVL